MKVGFIGLGRMGRGMAANLLAGGIDLTVHDLQPDAMSAVAARGAATATTPAALAEAVDLLFMCLPFAPEVRAALFATDGVASGARDGLVVVDATTLNHVDAIAIGEQAAQQGLRYNDCPISGMPMRAEDGTLTIMFGGDGEDFALAKPCLDLMGSYVIHCGALGNGQMMKAVNNIVYDINIVAICEVLPMAVKAGLDLEQVADVLTSGSSRSFASEYFVPRILDGQFDSDFPMGDAYKDIVNVQQIASRVNACTPVVDAMTAVYQLAMAQGLSAEPKSAMVKVYEQVLGLSARRR